MRNSICGFILIIAGTLATIEILPVSDTIILASVWWIGGIIILYMK